MELKHCLGQLPGEALNRLAGRYELDRDDEALPERLGEALLSLASNSLVSSFQDEQVWALKLICLCRQGQGLVVEQCHQKLNQTTRQWRRNSGKVVQALMDSGLVFTKRCNYRQVYFVPNPLRDVLIPQLTADIWARCTEPATSHDLESDDLKAVRLLYLFLSYVSKNPVRLTQAGGIFKRAQRDIMAYLDIVERFPEEGPVPVNYPPSLALLYYYCRSRRLVENRDGRLIPSEQLEEWLATSPEEKVLDLFSFWQEAYLQQDTDLDTLFGLVRLAPTESFLKTKILLKEMESFSLGQSWQGLAARAERFFFSPLNLLGMLETVEVDGERLSRLNELGRKLKLESPLESTFFVQPDYELLVPKNLHPDLLWTLETFCDLEHPDQLMVYRLHKHSVYRALNSGMTIKKITEFLKKGSKHQLPSNILSLLSEWGSTYGRLELLDVLVLHCEDEQLAREIEASKRLASFVEGKLTEKHLIIKRERHKELLNALTEEGYMPKS